MNFTLKFSQAEGLSWAFQWGRGKEREVRVAVEVEKQ